MKWVIRNFIVMKNKDTQEMLTKRENKRGETGKKLGSSGQSATLCVGPRRQVTCGSPPGTRVVLVGAGLADSWLHGAPLGRRWSLNLHLFVELGLLDHSCFYGQESVKQAEGREHRKEHVLTNTAGRRRSWRWWIGDFGVMEAVFT